MSTTGSRRTRVGAVLLAVVALLSACTGGYTGASASTDLAGPDGAVSPTITPPVTAVPVTASPTITAPTITAPVTASPTTTQSVTAPATTTQPAPAVRVSVPDGSTGVSPIAPVTVTATDGTLGDVQLLAVDGTSVPGVRSPDGVTWMSSEPLAYKSTYRVTVGARQQHGSATSRFSTVAPRTLTLPYLNPTGREVVGIGQSAAVKFDEPVQDKAAAEAAITVTTTPAVEGAFYWFNDQEVRWRPQYYWTPGTQVQVMAAVYGKDMGGGVYGQQDVRSSFTIGDAVVGTADDDTKTLSVAVNGEVVKSMPISMGKNSTPTDNGVYIVADQHTEYTMDSSTYGVPADAPDGYVTKVQYASRLSYSGIFVHGAPWSVGDQGQRNVSHGCLNVSVDNARWFYDNVGKGDVVVVQNTVGPTLAGNEGLGDWNVPWEEWRAGGAE